ncbi:Protein quaking-A [Takifugu flavidus]|uniref:Protein quaking-A n=1 Tax=Takifugu flavidus TaxID=433684 RepID=A0A5C6NWX7_9TELE|nr:Protein quaking-A [Takifugu flavidus]
MMVGEVEVKERPRPSPDYLMQLLNEKKLMTSLPNLCGIFTHLERLLDEGRLAARRQGKRSYKRPWQARYHL